MAKVERHARKSSRLALRHALIMNRLANCLLVLSFLGFVADVADKGENVFSPSPISWLEFALLIAAIPAKFNYYFGSGAAKRRDRTNEVAPWLSQEKQWHALRKTILIALSESGRSNNRAIRSLRLQRASSGNPIILDRAAKLLMRYVADPESVAMPQAVTQEMAAHAIDFLGSELTGSPYADQPLPTHVDLDDIIEQRALSGLQNRTIGEASLDLKKASVRSDLELRKQLAKSRERRLRDHQEPGKSSAKPSATQQEGG
jgi:hypothetical protein